MAHRNNITNTMLAVRNIASAYGRAEGGNIAMMTAVSLIAILGVVGAAVDYRLAANHKLKAQNLADATALAAAVHVGVANKDKTKNQAKVFEEGKTYKGEDFNQPFRGLTQDDATVTFTYDEDSKSVTAKVVGDTRTTLTAILGHTSVPFTASATAEYPESDLRHPASIAMVIDNSNSMYYDEHISAAWDQDHYDTIYSEQRSKHNRDRKTADYIARTTPTGLEHRPLDTTQRLQSVKTAMTSLNKTLFEAVDNDPEQRFLRTGLIPFNHNVINSKRSKMDWGPIPAAKISGMSPSGETDTSKGMSKAMSYLNGEYGKYDSRIRDDLKRYVILMSDGNNTVNPRDWVAEPGTGVWRGQEKYKTKGGTKTYRTCEKRESYTVANGERGNQTKKRCVKWSEKKTKKVESQTKWRWVNRKSGTRPTDGKNWTEGKWKDRTLNKCQQMKNKDWTIYTVGYALKAGVYQMNVPDHISDKDYWGVSPDDIDEATSLLESCASSPDHFILAEDAKQLEVAFEKIGASIASDTVLRLK